MLRILYSFRYFTPFVCNLYVSSYILNVRDYLHIFGIEKTINYYIIIRTHLEIYAQHNANNAFGHIYVYDVKQKMFKYSSILRNTETESSCHQSISIMI